MWIETVTDKKGKVSYKFVERYVDPYTEKEKRKSITFSNKSAQTKKKAQQLLNEKINKDIEKNKNVSITFGELFKEWFAYYKQHVKRSSYIKVKPMMKHINKVISDDVIVKNIDEHLAEMVFENMYTFGKLSLNYTNQTKALLSSILSYAVDKKYIEANPILSFKIKPKKIEEEKRKQTINDKFLERDEMCIVIEELNKNKRKKLHALIAEFLYLTGLRYGELIALQLKDYDGKQVSVNGTLDYTSKKMSEAEKTTPKNVYSNRSVLLPDRAIELIEQAIADNILNGHKNEDGYIFVSKKGTPLSVHAFNNALHNVESKVNKNLTSHIFRHSHVSLLAEMGIPLKAIMDRVGHSDANTTLKIYNHVTKRMSEQVIEKLNSL